MLVMFFVAFLLAVIITANKNFSDYYVEIIFQHNSQSYFDRAVIEHSGVGSSKWGCIRVNAR